jgi:sugar/nucleoside kinase (ribokinase family)
VNDLNARFLFLGNIQPELQLKVINDMHSYELIITDTMNLWIEIAKQKLKNVFTRTNVLLLNHEEAFQYTNEKKLELAAEKLHDSGPKIVIIKLGSDGAYLSEGTSSSVIPVFPINNVIDPTGAGDSFAGGLIGHLSNAKELNFMDAVITGCAMASFAVENFGVSGIFNAKKSTLNHRIRFIKKQIGLN